MIEKGYVPSLVNSLWIADEQMTNTLLTGIRCLPDICHLQIDRPDEPPKRLEKPNQRTIEHQYPLAFLHDDKNVPLGKLYVWASLDNVYKRLEGRFLIILATQSAGVFLTSILLYFLFHTLVGRHIYAMGAYARNLELDELAEPLSLIGKKNRGDELDHLVFSINQMKSTINEELMRRSAIEKELLESEVQTKKANEIMAESWSIPTYWRSCWMGSSTSSGSIEPTPTHADMILPSSQARTTLNSTRTRKTRLFFSELTPESHSLWLQSRSSIRTSRSVE